MPYKPKGILGATITQHLTKGSSDKSRSSRVNRKRSVFWKGFTLKSSNSKDWWR